MTSTRLNKFDQEVGYSIDGWQGRNFPQKTLLAGKYCELQPISVENHASQLYESFRASGDSIWTYVPIGPFKNLDDFKGHIKHISQREDEVHFAVVDKKTGKPVGTIALIRIDAANGSVEVGYVIYSAQLKKTPVATEAQYLLMRYVFDELKYRRYEWKCDSLNGPSKAAAQRLGFKFEGTFRQVVVYKGRNRDTTWLSVIDTEWDHCKQAFEKWLGPDNLQDGVQAKSLSDIRQLCHKDSF